MKVLFVNLTITVELFLLILFQALIRSGGTSQSQFYEGPFCEFKITVELFLLILLQALTRSGGTSQSSLPKMLRTFSSKTSAPTSLGMPITSKHSLLEYRAFSQH